MCREAMINLMKGLFFFFFFFFFLSNPLIQLPLCAFKTSLQYYLQVHAKIKF